MTPAGGATWRCVCVAGLAVVALTACGGGDDTSADEARDPTTTSTTVSLEPTAACLDAVESAVSSAEERAAAEGQRIAPTLTQATQVCSSADDFVSGVEQGEASFQGLLPLTVVRIECAQNPGAGGCDGLDPPGADRLEFGGAQLCDGLDILLAGLQLDIPFEGAELQQEIADLEADARRSLEDEVFAAPEPIALAVIDATEASDDRDSFAAAADTAYEACVEFGYSRPDFG